MRPHVLACRLDNAGDVLLAGPALRALAAGAAKVTMLCGPRGAEAARMLPGVREVIIYDAPWVAFDPTPLDRERTLGLVELISRMGIDQAFIFTSFHQSPLPLALLLRLAGVPFVAASSVDYPGSLLDIRHLPEESLHEVERSLSLVERAGYTLPPDDDGRLAVRLPQGEHPLLLEGPYIAVHPGASVPARTWNPERHATLVGRMLEEGWRVVVTGGPEERKLTARVTRGRPGTLDLGGRTTLSELARILAGSRLLVTGNTGPAHLAAAVGTPVISLFAPTVPLERWHPWKVPHRLLYTPVPCAGCRARVCPFEEHPCLGGVGVEEVLEAVSALMEERAR